MNYSNSLTFIYGVIDDLYQENARFAKYFSIRCKYGNVHIPLSARDEISDMWR